MLEMIRKLMGISNNEFDSIINTYIASAKLDLEQTGIISTKIVDTDALIESAIVSYVLSLLDTENAELYTSAYALQKDQLRHFSDYVE